VEQKEGGLRSCCGRLPCFKRRHIRDIIFSWTIYGGMKMKAASIRTLIKIGFWAGVGFQIAKFLMAIGYSIGIALFTILLSSAV
jgi:hypothetical protein